MADSIIYTSSRSHTALRHLGTMTFSGVAWVLIGAVMALYVYYAFAGWWRLWHKLEITANALLAVFAIIGLRRSGERMARIACYFEQRAWAEKKHANLGQSFLRTRKRWAREAAEKERR